MQILFIAILIFSSFIFPSSSFASHVELKPCVEIAHCVREEWKVNNIEKPFEEIKTFIENTPRTEIVEIDGDYLHAEATSKWMKYVDAVSYTHLTLPTILLV